jgi:hypothetical protein
VNISTERSVTSLRQDGARVRPVSVNHDQESGVGSAEGASGRKRNSRHARIRHELLRRA